MKKIMLGTSDPWWISHSSYQPREPAYHNEEDCLIFYNLGKNLIEQKVRGMKSGIKSEYSFFCWKRGKVGGILGKRFKRKMSSFLH